MQVDEFTADLLKMIKKHQPATVGDAYEMSRSLAGAMIGIANGVDAAQDNIYASHDGWRSSRAKFMAGAMYLLASTTPEVEATGLSMENALDSLLPLLVEKCVLAQIRDEEAGEAKLLSIAVSYLLKQATGLWLTLALAPKRPDMNTEQMEAKGQTIMDSLVEVFTQQNLGK